MAQTTFILTPIGGEIFGYVEGKTTKHFTIEDGPIYLQEGFHRTFGQKHIWARHSAELIRKDYETIDDVAAYVAAILQPNTPVLHEGVPSWEQSKLFAIRSAVGFAVLKQIPLAGNQTGYSVTTAYQRPRPRMQRVTRIVHR